MNPEIIEEVPISMGDLKDELKLIKKRDKELNYRESRTEEYLHHFVTMEASKRDELKKKIQALNVPRLKDIHVLKVIDLMPRSVDDLKVILQGYPITVNNENLKRIVDVVQKYLPERK